MGRALRSMPATEAAWLHGNIGEAHVEPLTAVRRRVGRDRFDPDEAQLVNHAKALPFQEFGRLLTYWAQAADPDGAERDAQAQRDARRLHLSQSFEGMWFAEGLFDPVAGEIVARALKSIEDDLFQADWAQAKANTGEDGPACGLRRTPAQRRADALVEMARRAAATPSGSRLPQPLMTVLVDYQTLAGRVCELASGTVIFPGSLLPWLTEAYVERVVFDGPDRVKNVSVRRRLFTGATRRAVEVRDRERFSEFCDARAEDCDIDHVDPYGSGGLTVDDNGRPACDYHNRRRHRPP